MGGMKVWHVLMLLALAGLVQAEIATSLVVYTYPQSPQPYGTNVMFFARYTDSNGNLLDGVTLYIDNAPKTTTQTINGSVYTTTLTSGTHTWYFSASKAGYAPKNSTLGYYVITGGGGGGSPLSRIVKMEETPAVSTDNTSWMLAVTLIAVIGLGIGYFVVRSAMFSTVPTKKAKKK